MPNWSALNENLRSGFSGLADYARQEKAKTDAFQALIFKAAIEQKFKERAMQNLFNQYKQMGFGTSPRQSEGSVMPGTEPTIEPVKNDYSLVPTGDPDKPFKFELSPQAQLRQKETEAKVIKKAQLTEELNVKRQQYKVDLNNFLAIDDILHQARGEGAGRFGAGFGMSLKGITQSSKLGQAVGAYDAVSKRLRVQLVRAAGDVGNINIVEQQAAEKLIPSKFDSKKTADIKRAYLMEISKAIDSQDPSLVKETLDKIGVDYTESKKDYNYLWE